MTPIAALHSLHVVNPCHAPVVPLLTCEEVCPDRTNAGVRVKGRGRTGQEVGGPITRPLRPLSLSCSTGPEQGEAGGVQPGETAPRSLVRVHGA